MTPSETGNRRETGKQRTSRIPLDYFKRPDALSRAKGWLSAAAALAAVAWLSGVGWDARPWSRRAENSRAMATHGPLARVHATWDSECDRCHVPFRPIDGSSWAAPLLAGAAGAHSGDTKCKTCHNPPDHNPSALAAQESCAACHHDHRGREASLVAVADADCTRCHAALASHTKEGRAPGFAASVSRFDADRAHHPEFALFRGPAPPADPGRVKFNHASHMTPGLNPKAGGRPLMTLADLKPDDRRRYEAEGAKDARGGLRLECASCHRPEGGRGGGAAMRPVRFESDCKACHPLTFERGLPPLPHGLQPGEVVEALWQTFSGRYVRNHPETPDPIQPPARAVPGRDEPDEVRAAQVSVARDVARAEAVVFGEKKCGECHHYEAPGGGDVPPPDSWDAARPVRVAPPNVTGVWFRHAAFDHSAHSSVSCRDCHAAAYADDRRASRDSVDVILPTVAVCQTCHAPRAGSGATATGGAGFGCTECHDYHGGGHPAAASDGRGPLARDAAVEATLKAFLGGPPPKAGG